MAGPDLQGLINPRLLAWAREMARLDLATAAKRAGTTEERLRAWENGERTPTLTQARSLAAAYKRSLGVFFLRDVPQGSGPRPVDYRRFELSQQHLMSPELAAGIREAEAKRQAALDIFIQLEDEPPTFDLFIDRDIPPEEAARVIAQRLGLTLERRRGWGDQYTALATWKAAVEELGIFVIQLSGVELREMRAATLAAFPLPVILLNGSDSPLGRVFSLLHELTHLTRAESALCDEVEEAPRGDAAQLVEVYCNRVAGAVLVPSADLLAQPGVGRANAATRWTADELRAFQRIFWASREVILRRLLINGKTSQQHYQDMRAQFEQEYAALRDEGSGGFVPFPRKVVLNNGRRLTRLVLDAYNADAITGSELSRILGTKLDHLGKIAEVMRERSAA